MGDRLGLHEALLEVMNGGGPVYYQPPASVSMTYPCITYHRETYDVDHADNRKYRSVVKYQITVIDKNPDSNLLARVMALPYVEHQRTFRADQLNHDIFVIYF